MAKVASRRGCTVDPDSEPGEGIAAEPPGICREMQASRAGEGKVPAPVDLAAPDETASCTLLALEAERQRYQDLFDFAPDGYLVTDREGRIQEANHAAAELLREDRSELVGKPLAAFVHRSDRRLLQEQTAELLQLVTPGPASSSGSGRHALGAAGQRVARAEVRLQPRRGAAFTAALGVAATQGEARPNSLRWLIRDVSERKQDETERERLLLEIERQRELVEALAVTLERDWDALRTIMENTETCLAYLGPDLRLQRFNLAFAQAWGTDETGLLDEGRIQLAAGVENRAILEKVRETGQALSLRARPLQRAGEGEPGTTHWDWTLAPVKDGSGRVQGLVVSLLDVTEEVRAAEEQARARAALHRQNEELLALMRELNAFAHTVAHDLKQPLTIVMGFADMLGEELGAGLDDQAKKMVEGIKQGARRMNNIVEGLLLLASTRSSDIEPRPLHMAGIVHEVLHALRLAAVIAEAGGELVVPATWPRAAGYAPWVESVWANYLTNAVKYGGRPLRIELGGQEVPGGHARFWVRDNGKGLTPEEQSRLFTSFTRLGQPRSLGHGLGLTIVRRIVERLGGEVGVESEPGEGSTFWFTLPAGTEPRGPLGPNQGDQQPA